jgi:peptidoglycan/LPS O-acetylase OafA/YrhL
VEAQFYLVWPLILLLVLRYFGKNKIPGAALLIAAFSGIALLVVSLQIDAASTTKVSHVYFGTDTHSIGLFLGAALAVRWIPQNLQETVTRKAQDFIESLLQLFILHPALHLS